MSNIVLVRPNEEMKIAATAFKNEFFEKGENVINGGLKLDNIDDYGEWLQIVNNSFSKESVNPKWGVTHTFFAVRSEDQKIVGIINLRLYLTEKFQYSGHIGYSVRPSERKKGYAGFMLKQIIEYAKSLNMLSLDIVCKSDNIASIKTVQHVRKGCQQISQEGKEIFNITLS